ncbi:MAG: 4Fe-4S double cluster binding domain-containing protein [Promethearchaeota archaeon]
MSSQTGSIKKSPDFIYKYKTMSVDRFRDLQEDIIKLKRENKLSDHEVYRRYIDELKFELPENFPEAKSVIVIAMFTKLRLLNFHLNGDKHEVMLPPGYFRTGLSNEILQNIILNEIIKNPGYRIEKTGKLHQKLLAVRSGLARYGRNNISYVDGMGSMHRLFAFFTDYQFEEDNWNEERLMKKCQNCKICINKCPNNAIREDKENFVIDVGKCVTLYNEIEGEFPEWISLDAHNALMGCMKCQLLCPANREVIKLTERMEDVTEEETRTILDGITTDDDMLTSISKKIQMTSNDDPEAIKSIFPIISRNLRVLIDK